MKMSYIFLNNGHSVYYFLYFIYETSIKVSIVIFDSDIILAQRNRYQKTAKILIVTTSQNLIKQH